MEIKSNKVPLLGLLVYGVGCMVASATEAQSSEGGGGESGAEIVSVEVDWFAEVVKGGVTSIALVILLMAGFTFAIERILASRHKNFAPDKLAEEVYPLWNAGEFEQIHEKCEQNSSTLGRMVSYIVSHRETDPGLLIPGALDIGAREIKRQLQRNFALAVIAALAPLLGLLGTMIGMIESFKLVEVYGDDGGASMLAGSISKALITTAVGLIIAIGTLVVHHLIKARINAAAENLEENFEHLINHLVLTESADKKKGGDIG